jgi:hypothetical protein
MSEELKGWILMGLMFAAFIALCVLGYYLMVKWFELNQD